MTWKRGWVLYEDSEYSQTVKIRSDQQVMDKTYYLQNLAGTFWKSRDFSGHVTIENEVIGYSAFRHVLRQSQERNNITNPAIRSGNYSSYRNWIVLLFSRIFTVLTFVICIADILLLFAIIEFLDVCKILEKKLHFLKTTINFHDLTSLDTCCTYN